MLEEFSNALRYIEKKWRAMRSEVNVAPLGLGVSRRRSNLAHLALPHS